MDGRLFVPPDEQITSQQQVGFPCPKCGMTVWTPRQLIDAKGRTYRRRVCPSRYCDWSGFIELTGCVGART